MNGLGKTRAMTPVRILITLGMAERSSGPSQDTVPHLRANDPQVSPWRKMENSPRTSEFPEFPQTRIFGTWSWCATSGSQSISVCLLQVLSLPLLVKWKGIATSERKATRVHKLPCMRIFKCSCLTYTVVMSEQRAFHCADPLRIEALSPQHPILPGYYLQWHNNINRLPLIHETRC